MKIRRFLLENEKGKQFRLDDIKEGCVLISPTNLGYSYKIDFEQLDYDFVENNKVIEQKDPGGIAYFLSYDKVKEFIDFIESSEKLKWLYIIPFKNEFKTYYRDVTLIKFDKTEKVKKWLACPILFAGLSLWYEQNETIFKIENYDDEMRYPYSWNSRYIDYNNRSILFNNKGHVEAPFKVEMSGLIQNPCITILVNKEEYASIKIPITINEYEKFLYSSKTGETYIQKQKEDGTKESLWKQEYINIANQNIFKLPLGASKICLSADNDILDANLEVFQQYKAV